MLDVRKRSIGLFEFFYLEDFFNDVTKLPPSHISLFGGEIKVSGEEVKFRVGKRKFGQVKTESELVRSDAS